MQCEKININSNRIQIHSLKKNPNATLSGETVIIGNLAATIKIAKGKIQMNAKNIYFQSALTNL
jgi:hypothetical protein